MDDWSDGDWARVMRVRRYRRVAAGRKALSAILALGASVYTIAHFGWAWGLLTMIGIPIVCRIIVLALSVLRPFGGWGSSGNAGGSGRPVRPTSTPPVLSTQAAKLWNWGDAPGPD